MNVRTHGRVINTAMEGACGVTLEGLNEVLGSWAAEREGATCWVHVVTALKHRGVQDSCIAGVAGVHGVPEAIEAVVPAPHVQRCFVHLVRHSLRYGAHTDRKEVATALKAIDQAATSDAAERQ